MPIYDSKAQEETLKIEAQQAVDEDETLRPADSEEINEEKPLPIDDPEWQRNLVAMIVQKPDLLGFAEQHLPPRALTVNYHQAILRIAYDHWRQFGQCPGKTVLLAEIKERYKDKKDLMAALSYACSLDYFEDGSPEYYKDVIRKYAVGRRTAKVIGEALKNPSLLYDPAKVRELLIEKLEELQPTSPARDMKRDMKRSYSITELAALPKPEWQIRGLFPEKSIVILWGQSGSGKSFLALEWGLSTALGLDWLGRPVKQGSVVYIAAEGKSGIPKRCLRWLEHHGQTTPDNFWVVPEAFELIQKTSLDDLTNVVQELGDQHRLIVIDTLNRNLGGNENDGEVMGAFVRAAEVLQNTFDCTVLIIHHTGWDAARERGHSSLRCNADTMISAAKVGEHLIDGIEISCIKQKDSDLFPKFAVRGTVVGQGDDSSVVLTEEFDLSAEAAAIAQEQKQQRADCMLARLIRLLPTEPNGMTPEVLAEQSKETALLCRKQLKRAYDDGLVLRVGQGVKHDPYSYWLTDEGQALIVKHDSEEWLVEHQKSA